ncbi:uncharacterized protein V1510DRAFT_420472 [Dipodascopsis tothii]|uniref:uncharacterized protein n=1 Tax=Dipodascopsis tothii TaxID=44089 RepID=UPI0034CE784A
MAVQTEPAVPPPAALPPLRSVGRSLEVPPLRLYCHVTIVDGGLAAGSAESATAPLFVYVTSSEGSTPALGEFVYALPGRAGAAPISTTLIGGKSAQLAESNEFAKRLATLLARRHGVPVYAAAAVMDSLDQLQASRAVAEFVAETYA